MRPDSVPDLGAIQIIYLLVYYVIPCVCMFNSTAAVSYAICHALMQDDLDELDD